MMIMIRLVFWMNFFSSQSFLDDSNAVLPDLTPHATNSVLDTIIITPLEVDSSLKFLDTCKASGPNGLSNRILKELSKELATPLCSLFNLSLSTGILPISYKEAKVCSVYKKDDPSLVSSYRPISLLNSEDKVFERNIYSITYKTIIYSHLYSLDSYQATVNQLTFLYNTFCQALDAGKEIRVVFCDVSKAFDRMWHKGLIHKLEAAGVTGKLLAWCKNYLYDRKQRVILPGVSSDWSKILAGVPCGAQF